MHDNYKLMTHILKGTLLLICLSINTLVFAQANYSLQQLTDFAQVYTTISDNSEEFKPDHEAIFTKLGVTEERYREILDQRESNNIPLLKAEEQLLLDAIRSEHQRVIDLREETIRSLCESKNLKTEVYYTILLKYKTDAAFKETIAPLLKQKKD